MSVAESFTDHTLSFHYFLFKLKRISDEQALPTIVLHTSYVSNYDGAIHEMRGSRI